MHYNTRVNKIIEEQFMSYKVLNTISTKNLSGKEIVKYKSSLLVVVVDKTFTKNELISNMDESTKGSFKRSIRHFLNSKASSVHLQNVNGLFTIFDVNMGMFGNILIDSKCKWSSSKRCPASKVSRSRRYFCLVRLFQSYSKNGQLS